MLAVPLELAVFFFAPALFFLVVLVLCLIRLAPGVFFALQLPLTHFGLELRELTPAPRGVRGFVALALLLLHLGRDVVGYVTRSG